LVHLLCEYHKWTRGAKKHLSRHMEQNAREYAQHLLWKFVKVSDTLSVDNSREFFQWHQITAYINTCNFARRFEKRGPVSSNKDAGVGECSCNRCVTNYAKYVASRQACLHNSSSSSSSFSSSSSETSPTSSSVIFPQIPRHCYKYYRIYVCRYCNVHAIIIIIGPITGINVVIITYQFTSRLLVLICVIPVDFHAMCLSQSMFVCFGDKKRNLF
jgi:hypothetical protein